MLCDLQCKLYSNYRSVTRGRFLLYCNLQLETPTHCKLQEKKIALCNTTLSNRVLVCLTFSRFVSGITVHTCTVHCASKTRNL